MERKPAGLLFLICSRQDSTYHDLNYTICGEHARTRYSSVCPPFHHEESIRRSVRSTMERNFTFRAIAIGLFVVIVFIVVYYFLIYLFFYFFLQIVCSMLVYLYKGERDVAR